MKGFKTYVSYVLLFLFALVLVGCEQTEVKKTDEEILQEAIKLVTLESSAVKDFILPLEVKVDEVAVAISWTSSDQAIKVEASNAKVTRPLATETNKEVSLTATFKLNEAVDEKIFKVNVLAKEKLAPVVSAEVYHWIPGAVGVDIEATLEMNDAPVESLVVKHEDKTLEDGLDYELDDSKLVIFGMSLNTMATKLGKFPLTITTEFGSTVLELGIVDNPKGTSIPTKEIQDYNMADQKEVAITEVIADAPELLITEMSAEAGLYTFIEVFNNTNKPYNLKGHRIVFANTSATINANDDLYVDPLGMASGIYIYQDYIIPALDKAIIWTVLSTPWTLGSALEGEVDPAKRLIEPVDVANHVFGSADANLSIAKFKARWNITSNVNVFPVRPQHMLHNGTSGYDPLTGLGQPVAKSASNHWADINSSVANRAVQIQKVDQETLFAVTPGADIPAGATHYKYEWIVTNKEEEIYVNGVLDKSKIVAYGQKGTANYRESINGLGVRKVYLNEAGQSVGYALAGTNQVDTYNSSKGAYATMYAEAVESIVTAHVIGNIGQNETDFTPILTKWLTVTMEYTLPVKGSKLMRFVPRQAKEAYDVIFKDHAKKDLWLGSIAAGNEAIYKTSTVVVPVNEKYPVTYLKDGYNTVDRITSVNLTR